MLENVAKALFVKLGGRVARAAENPQREVWVLQRPAALPRARRRLWRTKSALAQQKNLRKAFHMARTLLTYRAIVTARPGLRAAA